MKTYAQRMKKPQFANPQQNISATAQMSNQALLGLLNEPEGDTRFSKALRAKFETKYKPDTENKTTLSSVEQANYENRFALPMDDVRVYHNSDLPSKFDAGAITYGTDIYIAPGQGDLLSHEMTHVAQQKLGQVKPTDIENQLPISRESSLENNADEGLLSNVKGNGTYPVVQCCKEIDESEGSDGMRVPGALLKNGNDLTEHGLCHGYTLSYLKRLPKPSTAESKGSSMFTLNKIGEAIVNATENVQNNKMIYSLIYGAALKSGLVKDLTTRESFTDGSLVGQILLFVNEALSESDKDAKMLDHYVPHSMIISGKDSVTGVNNTNSLGTLLQNEDKDIGFFITKDNPIQTFGTFSERRASSSLKGTATTTKDITKYQNKTTGGWKNDNPSDLTFGYAIGSDIKIKYLPVIGDAAIIGAAPEIEKRIQAFNDLMKELVDNEKQNDNSVAVEKSGCIIA